MSDGGDSDWAGLADNLPAAPRSVLQPLIEAWARGDTPPALTAEPGTLDPEPEMWLVGRATSAGCLLALRLRPDLDATGLAALVASGLDDDAKAAAVEDILLALTRPGQDGMIDPTRIVRADSGDVLGGFVNCILGLAEIISERSGTPADQVVRLCFSAADGSFGEPR